MRGIAAEIVEITSLTSVPDTLDLYTLGGAEDYAQRLATKHLLRHQGLQRAATRGAPVLAICAAIQVLGHWYETSAGMSGSTGGTSRRHDIPTTRANHRRGRLDSTRRWPEPATDRIPRTTEAERFWAPQASPPCCGREGAGNRLGDGLDGVAQGSVMGHLPAALLCLARNLELADMLPYHGGLDCCYLTGSARG